MRHFAVLFSTACTLLAGVSHAQSADYLPLDQGWIWQYEQVGGVGELLVEVSGTLDVFGVETVVLHNVVTGPDAQIYDNYWTRDAAGRLFLHGAYNEFGYLAYYDPPIVVIGTSPLSVGDQWCTTFFLYAGSDDPDPGGPYDVCFGVVDMQSVTVPAGTFAGVFIDAVAPPARAPASAYGLLGDRLAQESRPAGQCYVDGVGRIIDIISEPYELVSYSGPVVTQPSTWSHVKALFE